MKDDILAPHAAWELWTQLERDERTSNLEAVPTAHEDAWQRLTRNQDPARDLWTDSWLAALSQVLGCRMVTFDRGFRRFGLTALELLPQ